MCNRQINHKPITWQRVVERVKPCTSMKNVETTITSRQHQSQINNNKSKKKTWHWWYEKEFTHINTWTPSFDSKNHSYHSRTPFKPLLNPFRHDRPWEGGGQWSATPCMKNYDASQRNNYIMYLDANNLYGWAISEPLPTSNFK